MRTWRKQHDEWRMCWRRRPRAKSCDVLSVSSQTVLPTLLLEVARPTDDRIGTRRSHRDDAGRAAGTGRSHRYEEISPDTLTDGLRSVTESAPAQTFSARISPREIR